MICQILNLFLREEKTINTQAQSTNSTKSLRNQIQRMGAFLSAMVMPNIGAFIAWGILTALFIDRKSTRLNSSHVAISYAVFCLKKKTYELKYCKEQQNTRRQHKQPISRQSHAHL